MSTSAERMRRYRERHKAEVYKKEKEYRQAHPEIYNEAHMRYYYKKKYGREQGHLIANTTKEN